MNKMTLFKNKLITVTAPNLSLTAAGLALQTT